MTNIRFATEKDVEVILGFIKELAEYENMSKDVLATEELLKKNIFHEKLAQVIIAEIENEAIGFALYFNNFSTFLGKGGIYLEDLYVKPSMRNKGVGKALLKYLANLTLEKGYGRLEWSCLDWNEPSIAFYKERGATPMDEWTIYRVTGENLKTLANRED